MAKGKEKPKYHNTKQTQGNVKMVQYIEDLERNVKFKRALKRLKKTLKEQEGNEHKEFDKHFDGIIEKYAELNKLTKKIIKRFDSGYSKADNKLSEMYKLDADLFNAITLSFLLKGHVSEDTWKRDVDMCTITDRYDNLNYADEMELPAIVDRRKLKHAMAYPLSIDIHALASQRDVLDFIEKRWSRIEELLNVYRDDKPARFRKRKYKREMLDFIWENRHINNNDLKVKLDDKFPDNGLVYYEIANLKKIERQRRTE